MIDGLRGLQAKRTRVMVENPEDDAELGEIAGTHTLQIRNPAEAPVLVLLLRDPLEAQQHLDRCDDRVRLENCLNSAGDRGIELVLLVVGSGDRFHDTSSCRHKRSRRGEFDKAIWSIILDVEFVGLGVSLGSWFLARSVQ